MAGNTGTSSVTGLSVNMNVAIVTGAATFLGVVGALVLLLVALPDGDNKALYVGLVVSFVSSTLLTLTNLFTTARVKAQTTALTNGFLEAKVRTAVASVVKPELVHPGAEAQLETDRATVANWDEKAQGR